MRGHLKAKLKVAKRQSPDQDPEQLESFKAYLGTDLLLLNSFVSNSPDRSFNKIRFWCQDETRWCLTTICRRLITALGVKPVGSFSGNEMAIGSMALLNPSQEIPSFMNFLILIIFVLKSV